MFCFKSDNGCLSLIGLIPLNNHVVTIHQKVAKTLIDYVIEYKNEI